MADNVITNANDVELVLNASDSEKRGTKPSLGRIVVDEFSITREEDNELVSGVGARLPDGITNGDITHGFSFTIMGEDVSTFEMIAGQEGKSNIFSFTAQNIDGDGNKVWEFALDTCKANSEEISGTSGDPIEYAVEGIAVSLDKKSNSAWN